GRLVARETLGPAPPLLLRDAPGAGPRSSPPPPRGEGRGEGASAPSPRHPLPELPRVPLPDVSGNETAQPTPGAREAMHGRDGLDPRTLIRVLVRPAIVELHDDASRRQFVGKHA